MGTSTRAVASTVKNTLRPTEVVGTRHPFSKGLLPWPMAGVVLRWDTAWFIGTRGQPTFFLTHHEQAVPLIKRAGAHQEDHSTDGVQATSTTIADG